MVRRILFVLLTALAACGSTGTQAFAQAPTVPEPALERGVAAVRIGNNTDCPIAVRLTQDGEVKGIGLVPAHTQQWAHLSPEGVVLEMEIAVSPKLCGVTLPSAHPPTTPTLGLRAASLDRQRPLEGNVRVRLAARERPDPSVVAPH